MKNVGAISWFGFITYRNATVARDGGVITVIEVDHDTRPSDGCVAIRKIPEQEWPHVFHERRAQ